MNPRDKQHSNVCSENTVALTKYPGRGGYRESKQEEAGGGPRLTSCTTNPQQIDVVEL